MALSFLPADPYCPISNRRSKSFIAQIFIVAWIRERFKARAAGSSSNSYFSMYFKRVGTGISAGQDFLALVPVYRMAGDSS